MKGHPSGPNPDPSPPQGTPGADKGGGSPYAWVENHPWAEGAAAGGVADRSSGKSSAFAVASAVLFMFGPISVICGHIALLQMRKREVTIDGMSAKGYVWLGLVLGYMFTAFYVWMALITVDAVPNPF